MRFQLMGSSDPGLPVCERTFRKWQAPSLRWVYLGHFSVNCLSSFTIFVNGKSEQPDTLLLKLSDSG